MRLILVFCLYLVGATCFGQDLYIKSYSTINNQNRNIHIESFNDGSYVVAGYNNPTTGFSKIFIRKFNSCGIEMWSREVSDNLNPLDLVELNIDSSQNIIISGRHGAYNLSPVPYIVKFDQNGTVLFSKLLSSTLGYNSLIYSSSIAPNGDIYLFGIHRYTTSPPNNHKYYIARLNPNGNLKWAKNLSPFAFTWGRLLATRDGGVIIKRGNTIIKLDSLGNKDWAKDYTYPGDLITATETDSGYVFARYYIGAIDRGSVFSIRHDGSIHWKTDSYFNFFPFRGITRKNGNVLFPGSNPIDGNLAVFLELDFKDGSTVNSKELNNSMGFFGTDLTENADGEILFTGPDNRGLLPQLLVGKLNDTLSTLACSTDTIQAPGDPYSVSFLTDNSLTSFNNTDLTTTNFQPNIVTVSAAAASNICSYTKPRGSYSLGADTSLCIGQSVILGNSNSSFDSYLWSTGSTAKTIGVNQSGSYWLQVVAACDTLRDTINVSYLPGILFSLGADTITCNDSIVLGTVLDPSINYLWSTGETTRTITVKTSGYYWVQYSDKCNTTRDSIYVGFLQKLPEIWLGNDTILCQKQNVELGSSSSAYTDFLWSNGATTKTITITSAGTYWLKASNKCQVSTDTIIINYYPIIGINLGNDTSICQGVNLTLKPKQIMSNYLWSTGSVSPTITVNQSGIYWLETQTNCGAVRDSVKVTFEPALTVPNLGVDTTLCFGETLQLMAVNGVNYQWSNGESSQNIEVGAGVYWVDYFNKCDTIRDSIIVSYFPEIIPLFQVSQEVVTTFDTITFTNNTTMSVFPAWDLGDGGIKQGDIIQHVFTVAGSYQVELTVYDMNGCSASTTKTILVTANEYYAPNIFTPNNDKINDEFWPVGDDIKSYTINVFNRWGELVFKGKDVKWRGHNASGRILNNGIYHYIIHIELFDGKTDLLKGDITLIR